MTLRYGFVKAKLATKPIMKGTRRRRETQYHLHLNLLVNGGNWDVAVNVGTNDDDDLLKYKLVYDFRHPLIQTLAAAAAGARDLTDQNALPALDYQRGADIFANTGKWRDSDVMDGTEFPEPVASLKRLLEQALEKEWDVYVFGRFYAEGNGIHDTHIKSGIDGRFHPSVRRRFQRPQ